MLLSQGSLQLILLLLARALVCPCLGRGLGGGRLERPTLRLTIIETRLVGLDDKRAVLAH